MNTTHFVQTSNIFNKEEEKKNVLIYEFQILRYKHNILTGEFVNVGLVMFEPESSFLDFKATEDLERIAHFFNYNVSKDFLKKCFNGIKDGFTFHKNNTNKEHKNTLPSNLLFSEAQNPISFCSEVQNSKKIDIFEKESQKHLLNITNQILPKNDGALCFSEVKTALKIHKNQTMDDIFQNTFDELISPYTKK